MKKPTDAKQKIEAAKSTTDTDELRELALDSFVYVRAGAAINLHATEPILLSLIPDQLVTDDDFQVSVSLLCRIHLPPSVSHRLCLAVVNRLPAILPREWYPRQFVLALASHPSIAYPDLSPLLHAKICPRHLRGSVAASCFRKDVLKLLSCDVSSMVAQRARKRLLEDSLM